MQKSMRFALLLYAIVLQDTSAQATESRTRPATQSEIINHVDGASKLEKATNGFSYKPGGTVGYKFSNGQICVLRFGRGVDCVSVRTDGATFQMIDRTGTRQRF
jgi:hypothetical protein